MVTLAWTDAALTARLLGVDVEPWFPAREGVVVAFCRRLVLDRSTWTGLASLCRRVALAPVALAVPAVGASLASGLPAAPLADQFSPGPTGRSRARRERVARPRDSTPGPTRRSRRGSVTIRDVT